MPEQTPPPPVKWWQDFTKVMLVITTIIGAINGFQTNCVGQKADKGLDRIDHIATVQAEQLKTAAVIKETTSDTQSKVQVIDSKLRKN